MAHTPAKLPVLPAGVVKLEQSHSTEVSFLVAVLDEERTSCDFLHHTARAVPYPARMGAGGAMS